MRSADGIERGLLAVDVVKSYGAIAAVRGATIALRPYEVNGLVGDNGAGKSTLVKILSGVLDPDDGRFFRHGEQRPFFKSARDAQDAGVVTVYQDLALVDTLPIADNIFLGRELARGPFRLKRQMRRESSRLLQEIGVHVPDEKARVDRLSGGQRQGVAFARALNAGAEFFLLDEPTAATGARETREIISLVERLRDRGAAILLISHDIPMVCEVCSRITVMRRGETVASFDAHPDVDDVIDAMVRGTAVSRDR